LLLGEDGAGDFPYNVSREPLLGFRIEFAEEVREA
jgi:hypothetical protein